MSGVPFPARMAWRESRAARRRLALLIAAIAVGVGALVAINSVTQNVAAAVDREARSLLGADLALSSRQPFPDSVLAFLDSLSREAVAREACDSVSPVRPCGLTANDRISRTTEFGAMAYVARTAGTRLVRVFALEGPFPYYGAVDTEPIGVWDVLQSGRHALVDPAVLTALEARVGDTLAIGQGRFVVIGTISNIPGDIGFQNVFAPRVFIPAEYLDETELLGFGARISYDLFLKLEPTMDVEAIANANRSALRRQRIGLRTVESDREELGGALTSFGRFLGLVALMALLLGGLGVASAVHVFVKQKRETIAVLRCLGAPAGTVFRTYLTQALAIGLLGGVLGVGLGVGVQMLLPSMVRDLLPVGLEAELSWSAIGLGLATGVWVATIFSLLPLLRARYVSPLAALREPFEVAQRLPRDRWRWVARAALATSVILLALIQARHVLHGLSFAGAIGVGLLVLWGAAVGLTKAVRRWLPQRSPYVVRQGLANLFRPANQTVAVILALGFGAFLVSTLFLVQHNFLRQLRVDTREDRPNLLIYDIQPDQLDGVLEELAAAGLPPGHPVPIVPMRIASVKGEPVRLADVEQEDGDTAARSTWAHRREYRSTYRDTLVGTERLVAGTWWAGAGAGDAGVSLEEDIAEMLDVDIGDDIVWDVQGIALPSTVTSIRRVDWTRFQTNFFAVFEPGALEDAPQMFVTETRVGDPASRGTLQRRLAERFPNVSSLDLSVVQRAVDRIINRLIGAVRFVAVFSVLTGIVVLVGALATSRYQRLREGVLLKTLGATRRQIVRIVLTEYAALGLLAAVVAIVLSGVAGWGLMIFVFETSYRIPLGHLAALAGGMALLTMVVGVWNSLGLFRAPPLQVLRAE